MAEAFIYDALRTPRGKGKADGSLHPVQPIELLTNLLNAVKERNNNLDPDLVEDCVIGCVSPVGEQGSDIARAAIIAAGFNQETAGVQMNRFCGSGLEAINTGSAYVMSGQSEMVIAGGVESMSRVPMGSDGGAMFTSPDMIAKHKLVPQGISADLIATLQGYSRQDVDAFAAESHKRATEAREKGYYDKSIVPVTDNLGLVVLGQDEGIRPGTSVESLSSLKPSFEMMGQMGGLDDLALQKYPQVEKITHVHHAGNSSQIVDGSALVLIGTKEAGEKANLKPRARMKAFTIIGTEPTIMLTGPVPATQKALKKAGMELSDIDLFEVNEAFAAVPMYFMDKLGVDHSKVNPVGGAIALGHPLGATGAAIMGTMVDELERQDKNTGLITLCIGGGMGIATIIERV